MAFIESPRFPAIVARDLIGGPTYLTEIIALTSGHEQRDAMWSMPRQRYTVPLSNLTQTQMDALLAFLRVARGRFNGFRVRDPVDFRVSTSGVDGVVALISGDTYQLYKRYTSGSNTVDRKIVKPVTPIVVSGGGTYTIDYTTGVVTRTGGAAPTGWTGSFDVPCRCDTDAISVEAHRVSAGGAFSGSIPLIELRQA
jgi:uncharacterized protein (TIGR02217 family)